MRDFCDALPRYPRAPRGRRLPPLVDLSRPLLFLSIVFIGGALVLLSQIAQSGFVLWLCLAYVVAPVFNPHTAFMGIALVIACVEIASRSRADDC